MFNFEKLDAWGKAIKLAAALVEEGGCGVVLRSNDVGGIGRTILDYYGQFMRGELYSACAPEVLRRFERPSLTYAWARLLGGMNNSLTVGEEM